MSEYGVGITEQYQTRLKTYTDFTAQIIRHEVDRLDGVLI